MVVVMPEVEMVPEPRIVLTETVPPGLRVKDEGVMARVEPVPADQV